jgi:hypothetical protein
VIRVFPSQYRMMHSVPMEANGKCKTDN